MERNRSFVHGATTPAQKLALLKSACESIEEKGLIVTRSATVKVLEELLLFSELYCSHFRVR